MRALKALAVLPLLLAARITHRPWFLRKALYALVKMGEKELAVKLTVAALVRYSEDSEWLRDHAVPEEVQGEIWAPTEPSAV